MEEHKTLSNRWLKTYYIATLFIAIAAVAGLYVSFSSIRTAKEVSKTLEEMQAGLNKITQPMIKFKEYVWYRETGELSCDNPPIGIHIYFYNASGVAVEVLDREVDLFYGERKLPEAEVIVGRELSGLILCTGEKSGMKSIRAKEFKEYFSSPKPIDRPPHLRVKLTVRFRRFYDTQEYIYRATLELAFNCANPKLRSVTVESESVTPSPARSLS